MTRSGKSIKELSESVINSNSSTPIGLNDDKSELKKRHANIAQKRRLQSAQLLSPSPVSSPKTMAKLLSPICASGGSGRLLFQSPKAASLKSSNASPLLSKKAPSKENAPVLSRDQMNKLFEEWIKIAADNKINANNTWNLALIDYFSELSLLRDGDSINFQKASCTLDGCVKIYTSRVDSVANETGKLLTGLAENEENDKASRRRATGDDEDEDDHEDDETNGDGRQTKKKKPGNTLEKSENGLNVKKLDMEFDVDPLFKKTCADFDEGGASGLLLNNLSLNAEGRIVFDASEIISFPENYVFEDSFTDASQLKSKLNITAEELEGKSLISTFHGFEFSKNGDGTNLQDLIRKISENQQLNDDLDDLVDENLDYNNIDASFAAGAFMGPEPGMEFDEPLFENDFGLEAAFDETPVQPNLQHGHTRLTKSDYVVSLTNGDNNMYSYFDDKLFKNWAGPEHWRLRAFQSRDPNGGNGAKIINGVNGLDERKAKREEKKAMRFDFVDAEYVDPVALFASKTGSQASLTLSKAQIQDRGSNTHLLPEDLHFKSKDLLSFFSKPAWKLTGQQVFVPCNNGIGDGVEVREDCDEIDQENNTFYPGSDVVIATNQTISHEEGLFNQTIPDGPLFDMDDPLEAVNDNNDYYDDGFDGFPDDDDISPSQATQPGTVADSQLFQGLEVAFDFGNSLVAQPKLTKSIKMNFARTAKKVDVKRLKDNIWKEITEIKGDGDDGDERKGSQDDAPIEFTGLVKGLSDVYPQEKLQDISVPFCFICLLHLANERNLEIKSSNDLSELLVRHS